MRTWTMLLLCSCLVLLVGCGKKPAEDEPIADVKARAEKMSLDDLKKEIAKYEDIIKEKTAELEKIKEKVNVTELPTNEEAQKLTKSIAAYGERLKALVAEKVKKETTQ